MFRGLRVLVQWFRRAVVSFQSLWHRGSPCRSVVVALGVRWSSNSLAGWLFLKGGGGGASCCQPPNRRVLCPHTLSVTVP